MAGKIDARLSKLGIELPEAAAPAANYVPYALEGNTLYIAGQVPFWNGELLHIGKVGEDYSVEDAVQAARVCGLNIIAQAKAALGGDLSRACSRRRHGARVRGRRRGGGTRRDTARSRAARRPSGLATRPPLPLAQVELFRELSAAGARSAWDELIAVDVAP